MLKQSRQRLKFQALLAERAHFMRHNRTETEQTLWHQLAGSALGIAFKRQVPVDRYITDFLAPAAKLVVEVDGGVHSIRRTRDARRDRVLQRLGIACCGLMRNWCVAILRTRSLLSWPRYGSSRRKFSTATCKQR